MDRAIMAWLFAVFQYKNEGTSDESRGLKETKGGGSLTVGSSSVKFLAKGCCVHMKSMWIQRSGKYLVETPVGGYQTDKSHQSPEIPQAEKSWKMEQYDEWSILYFWLSASSSLDICLQTLFLGFACLNVHQPTGDETWDLLTCSSSFRRVQGNSGERGALFAGARHATLQQWHLGCTQSPWSLLHVTAQRFSLGTGGQGGVTGSGGDMSNLRTAAVGEDHILLSVGVGALRATLIMA